MKKCVIIPLSSGYYKKSKNIANEYKVDFDDRNLKPNQKIKDDKKKYKNIVCIGNLYIINDKIISGEKLHEALSDMNKKKKEKVVVTSTSEKNVVRKNTSEKEISE